MTLFVLKNWAQIEFCDVKLLLNYPEKYEITAKLKLPVSEVPNTCLSLTIVSDYLFIMSLNVLHLLLILRSPLIPFQL